MVRQIVVVGASLAGLRTAEALRARGYDGTLTLVGDEPHPPYDRPPLSKAVLQGVWEPDRVLFRRKEGYDGLALDMRLGVRAVAVDLAARHVLLEDATRLPWDRLVIATGSRARRLPAMAHTEGLYVLRTLDDARVLRDELGRARRVTIVGAGFIGLEVAASCRVLGLDVTMVDPLPRPLPVCGAAVGDMMIALHRDHGVDLRPGVGVAAFHGGPRVRAVELTDGARIDTDVVVVGVGVVPATVWLEGSGLTLDGGIVCDPGGQAAPGVFAAGDVARIPNRWIGTAPRIEHWSNAVEQASHVAAHVLGADPDRAFSSVPYFWSDQYDRKIQFVGFARPGDEMVVVEGSLEARQFTALYRRGEVVSACLTINRPQSLVKFRRLLGAGIDWAGALAAVSAH